MRSGPQSVWWALFSLQGRIRPVTFSWSVALLLVVWWVCLSQVFSHPKNSDGHAAWLLLLGFVALVSAYCVYALAHKRLHDLGYPGRYAIAAIGLGFFFPIALPVAMLVLAFVKGQPENNAYGPRPETPTADTTKK